MRYIAKDPANTLVKQAAALLAISSTYNEHDRVREIIRLLYGGCCVFCGSSIEEASFFQVEHFYPKAKTAYKAYEKALENLHYSCQRCNSRKGQPVHHQIFSPNYYLDAAGNWIAGNPEKIEREMYFSGHLLFSKNLKPGSVDRGAETIALFNLNNDDTTGRDHRAFLVERRLRHYNNVYRQVKALYELLEFYHPSIDKAVNLLIENLMRYMREDEPWSLMIIHNFGNEVLKLLEYYAARRRSYPDLI